MRYFNLIWSLVFALCVLIFCQGAFAVPASIGPHDYETVAASQTDQALGPVGGQGDVLDKLIIVPATTGAGTVQIQDGAGSEITVFVSGTLSDLSTITIPIGARSRAGAWSVTTGANVSVIAVGRFK